MDRAKAECAHQSLIACRVAIMDAQRLDLAPVQRSIGSALMLAHREH